jgi:hypothetical protein
MNITSKLWIAPFHGGGGGGMLYIEFECNGSKLGKLVRTTNKDYVMHQTDFINFVSNVRKGRSAVLDIDASTDIKLRIENENVKGELVLSISDVNTVHRSIMRSVWYDLLRYGFRRSLDGFS